MNTTNQSPRIIANNSNNNKQHFQPKEIIFKDGDEGKKQMQRYLADKLLKRNARSKSQIRLFLT